MGGGATKVNEGVWGDAGESQPNTIGANLLAPNVNCTSRNMLMLPFRGGSDGKGLDVFAPGRETTYPNIKALAPGIQKEIMGFSSV